MNIQRHAACPACGCEHCVPIVYGMPAPELVRLAERGEVELGGCCISELSPRWICRRCGERWTEQTRVGGAELHLPVWWSGPHTLDEVIRTMNDAGTTPEYAGEDYGLYQVYGRHILAGEDALLYVGRATEQAFADRFRNHRSWLEGEDSVRIYLGRLDLPERHTEADGWARWKRDVSLAERILIYKYSPNYNGAAVAEPANLDGYSSVVLMHCGERHRLHERDVAPADWH